MTLILSALVLAPLEERSNQKNNKKMKIHSPILIPPIRSAPGFLTSMASSGP